MSSTAVVREKPSPMEADHWNKMVEDTGFLTTAEELDKILAQAPADADAEEISFLREYRKALTHAHGKDAFECWDEFIRTWAGRTAHS